MKKDFQPEQKIGNEQKPIVLPSATDSAKPIVVCSQSPPDFVETINKEKVSKLVFDKSICVGTIILYEQEIKYCPPFGQSLPT